jgi:hypothetical protein
VRLRRAFLLPDARLRGHDDGEKFGLTHYLVLCQFASGFIVMVFYGVAWR